MSVSLVGQRLTSLPTPVFCVDRGRVVKNCEKMIASCTDLGVQLRAQTKTHKTIEGAFLQTGGTKKCIVTSTVKEAEFYVDAGFDDILYGYPLTPDKIPRCAALHAKLSAFHVLIDNETILKALCDSPPGEKNNNQWSVFLKVNCGNNRVGVEWDGEEGVRLGEDIARGGTTTLAGIYVHCGNTYHADEQNTTVAEIAKLTTERALAFVKRLTEKGISCPIFGIGSTPTCSHPPPEMKSLTEIHPGNYSFYDAQQLWLGSCVEEDIACWVLTRVVGHYPLRNEMLIDCGFAALTKQGMGKLPTGCCIFKGHPDLKLVDMTQEIGKVRRVDGGEIHFQEYPIGSLLSIYPWHSCATAALHPKYLVLDADIVVEEWTPCRGW